MKMAPEPSRTQAENSTASTPCGSKKATVEDSQLTCYLPSTREQEIQLRLSYYVYFFGLCVTRISPLSLIHLLCVCSEVWLCLTLCNPMECILIGSSVCGILQVKTLAWVAMPSSKGSSWPSDQTCVFCISCTSRWILLPTTPPGKPH